MCKKYIITLNRAVAIGEKQIVEKMPLNLARNRQAYYDYGIAC
jgi:hypothetical protein